MTGKDSERVFREGETVGSSFFFVRFLKNGIGHYRLAVLVPVKVSKNSTVRNRFRRLIAEIFKAAAPCEQPLDIVFVAAPSIVGRPPAEIKRSLVGTINRVFSQP